MVIGRARLVKKYKVEKLVEKHFWKGFWAYMNGDQGFNRTPELSYVNAPPWYDEVANIAQPVGWDTAKTMVAHTIKVREDIAAGRRRYYFAGHKVPHIPGEVYAKAYGAARVA